MNRKPIFDAVRTMLGRSFAQTEVATLDRAIDQAAGDQAAGEQAAGMIPAGHALGEAGAALIRKWEGCAVRRPDGRFAAYPDPGSADGTPWTIGWGATGPEIGPDTVWTQQQCDARFAIDIARYVTQVAQFLGDAATTPNQFDALVSFHYNTGAIRTATLGRLHKEGRYAQAQAQFAKWIYNDKQPMNGLISRRADEAALYAAP